MIVLQQSENPGEMVERECRDLGISVAQVAREAKVDRITIFRWKKGDTEPYWGTYQRVRNVIDGYWDRKGRS
jgi:predicted transcriptional regulator